MNDIPVFWEITNCGQYSLVFKAKDEEELAHKAVTLINNPGKIEQVRVESKKWAEDNCGIEQYIHNLRTLYSEL